MARKRKKLNQLTIEKVAAEGKCVTKNEEGQVVLRVGWSVRVCLYMCESDYVSIHIYIYTYIHIYI
jgi:hypothetical protein